MTRNYLVRGLLVGLIAGFLALLVAKFIGEPFVDSAIAFEEAHAHDAEGGEPPVSRSTQATLGLGTGVLFYGALLGGLYGLVTAIAVGRFGRLGPRGVSLVVAAVGFVAVHLVPFLKYPANPPAVGDPETINHRTALYFSTLVASIVLAVAVVLLARQLSAARDSWTGVLAGGGVWLLGVALILIVLPGVNEVAADFPASVLYNFRISTVAIHLTLWSALGLLFGWLTERALIGAPKREGVSVT